MIYLVAIKEYKTSRGTHYTPGAVVECDEERARYLEADAPGYFERFDDGEAARVRVKALFSPPEDKVIKSPPARKRGRPAKTKDD
jgi:hypothetical protein